MDGLLVKTKKTNWFPFTKFLSLHDFNIIVRFTALMIYFVVFNGMQIHVFHFLTRFILIRYLLTKNSKLEVTVKVTTTIETEESMTKIHKH